MMSQEEKALPSSTESGRPTGSSPSSTMRRRGNAENSCSRTPRSTLFGHRVISAAGGCLENRLNMPGVWQISPILTVRHVERSRTPMGWAVGVAVWDG